MDDGARRVGTATDLAGRVAELEAEVAALRQGEYRYRSMVEAMRDFLYVVTTDGTVLYANTHCVEMQRARDEVLSGRTLKDLFPPWVAERQLANIRSAAESRRPVEVEARSVVGGRDCWLHTLLTPIVDARGNVAAVMGVSRDITDRKAAEDALRGSEQRLAFTLRSIGEAVVTTDGSGTVDLMNRAAEDLTGWPASEGRGRPFVEVVALADEVTRTPLAWPPPPASPERQGPIVRVLARRDGQERLVTVIASPMTGPDAGVTGAVVVLRDETDRTRLARDLERARKLESVGLLAGGIAHDFNNVLTAVLGNLVLARLDARVPAVTQERLESAEKALMRATDLTHQLLTFSHGGAPVRRPVVLGPLVREWTGRALRPGDFRLEFHLADDLWAVEIDDGLVAQVVHHLVENACQAVRPGGLVKVIAENFTMQCSPGGLPDGRYVRVSVIDDGPGIAADVLPKVFDPYFTTRPGAAGLGLATAYSIVKNHEGHIGVESSPGKGARFHFLLPALAGHPAIDVRPVHLLSRSGGEALRVLVMDDEPFIRDVLGDMLAVLGCTASAAGSGEEALASYAESMSGGARFDAVILDLTVPGGMGGREAAACLAEIDPGVRAIATSGYSNDPVMGDYRRHGFAAALKKPFLLEDLRAAVLVALRGGGVGE